MIKNKRQGDKWNYDVIRFLADIFKLEAFNNKNHKTYEISTTKNTPISSLLTMRIKPGEIPLLFTRMTKKVTVKEQVLDELVIMRMEDFKLFLNEYVKSHQRL